jgi:hypothetical protein
VLKFGTKIINIANTKLLVSYQHHKEERLKLCLNNTGLDFELISFFDFF